MLLPSSVYQPGLTYTDGSHYTNDFYTNCLLCHKNYRTFVIIIISFDNDYDQVNLDLGRKYHPKDVGKDLALIDVDPSNDL